MSRRAAAPRALPPGPRVRRVRARDDGGYGCVTGVPGLAVTSLSRAVVRWGCHSPTRYGRKHGPVSSRCAP
ncbi:hypothetical protein SGPA1_30888 [Streptomyces misionensis JCM 4497]